MVITIVLLVVFFAAFAMLLREGIWSNALTLINVLLSALIATSLFEPLAAWLESFEPTYTYLWDFIAIWAVFCLSYALLRTAIDFISTTQVRFLPIVDRIGGGLLGVWIGWVLVCFITMTLHMAPMAQNGMGGSFQPTPEAHMFFGLAPDQRWLAFAHMVSGGSLATSAPEGQGTDGANVFDPQGDFIFKYAQRRANFEREPATRVYRGK